MRVSIPGEPTVSARVLIIMVIVAFAFGYFMFRLFRLQVVQHAQYAEASQEQSTSTEVQQAQRGQILARDRDGKIYTLAASQEEYQLLVVPQQVGDKALLASELTKLFPELNYDEVWEKINNDKPWIPPLLRGLSREEADRVINQKYKGVYVEPELVRVYPEGSAIAAQILGYVGADGQGKYGIEAAFDGILRGEAGSEQAKKDSFGRLIEILGGSAAEPGKDVLLTLDYNLQYFVERQLVEAIKKYRADSGSIIVMEAKTGSILALAGQPTYDPNAYSKLKPSEQTRFLTPAASLAYEAGSVVKPLTMAMALELDLVEPETTEVFSGSVVVGGHEIKNAEDKIYGQETMTQVLENSDNVAMVWLSKKIGAESQYSFLEKFGFGRKTKLELVGESAGQIHKLEDWNETLSATGAFGQGFSVTLLQLAQAYAALANGGITIEPNLVAGTISADGTVEQIELGLGERVLKQENAKDILKMLEGVVLNGHGKNAKVAGLRVGGKTGTAQVASPDGGYDENKHIGTFAGIFPINNPKYVMAVRLDDPKTVRFAESSAAPTFQIIGDWMANYFRLR